MRTKWIAESPKAPWDLKVLEPSLDVACQFLLLASWPSPLFYCQSWIDWFLFLSLSDMKSCRALTLHFCRYILRTSGIYLCSGISCFSPACNSLTLTFQINSASKPGCAANVQRCNSDRRFKFRTFYGAGLQPPNGLCFNHFCRLYSSLKS